MEIDHKIVAALAAIQKAVVAGCKCEDVGLLQSENHCLECTQGPTDIVCSDKHDSLICDPCPDCAEVRALDLCWHEEGKDKETGRLTAFCKHCHKFAGDPDWRNGHPDLTTHMHGSKLWIVHVMQVLGEWKKFVGHMNDEIDLACFNDPEHDCSCYMKVADILTDGKDLVPAIGAYLEERPCTG